MIRRELTFIWNTKNGTLTAPLVGPYLMREERLRLLVNTEVNLPDTAALTATLKLAGKFDGAPLWQVTPFTRIASGKYEALVAVSSAAIDTALGVDGSAANDQPSANCTLQLRLTEAGVAGAKSDTLALLLRNDTSRTDDLTPASLPTAEDWLDTRAPRIDKTLGLTAPQIVNFFGNTGAARNADLAAEAATARAAEGALATAITTKIPKVVSPTDGHLAVLNSDGTIRDGGVVPTGGSGENFSASGDLTKITPGDPGNPGSPATPAPVTLNLSALTFSDGDIFSIVINNGGGSSNITINFEIDTDGMYDSGNQQVDFSNGGDTTAQRVAKIRTAISSAFSSSLMVGGLDTDLDLATSVTGSGAYLAVSSSGSLSGFAGGSTGGDGTPYIPPTLETGVREVTLAAAVSGKRHYITTCLVFGTDTPWVQPLAIGYFDGTTFSQCLRVTPGNDSIDGVGAGLVFDDRDKFALPPVGQALIARMLGDETTSDSATILVKGFTK